MALPAAIANGLYISGIGGLASTPRTAPGGSPHSQITGASVTRHAVWYNCAHLAAGGGARTPGFRMTDNDPRNFLYVGNIPNGVAVGVAPTRAINMHVYSDNYGGCEWHILSRNDHSAAAFLHVYRGDGVTAGYALAGGWIHRGTVQSAPVVALGLAGSIVSYAYVASGSNVAECCMMRLNQQGTVVGVHEYQQVPI